MVGLSYISEEIITQQQGVLMVEIGVDLKRRSQEKWEEREEDVNEGSERCHSTNLLFLYIQIKWCFTYDLSLRQTMIPSMAFYYVFENRYHILIKGEIWLYTVYDSCGQNDIKCFTCCLLYTPYEKRLRYTITWYWHGKICASCNFIDFPRISGGGSASHVSLQNF